MTLDESQKNAIETAVKQRLTMIQGPPGLEKRTQQYIYSKR